MRTRQKHMTFKKMLVIGEKSGRNVKKQVY